MKVLHENANPLMMLMRDRVNRMIADETGQTIDKITQDTRRNFWMNARMWTSSRSSSE